MGNSIFHSTSHPSSLASNANSDASSILTARKRSKEYESSIHSNHNHGNANDMLTADDNIKMTGERKKSGSSSNSKGKDREKSEGSIFFLSEEGKNDQVTH